MTDVSLLPVSCSFDGVDIALFSAGGSISKKFGPAAQKAGAIVSAAAAATEPMAATVCTLSCEDALRLGNCTAVAD